MIQSEVEALSEELRAEIMGSPLLRSLCRPRKDLVFAKEFEWVLENERLTDFKRAAPSKYVISDTFVYEVSDELSVQFELDVERKAGGSESTGFGIRIKKINGRSKVSGQFSVTMA